MEKRSVDQECGGSSDDLRDVSGKSKLPRKNGHCGNRLLRDQSLTVSFVNPWQALAETNLAVRDTNDLPAQCANWWCLLDKARTFFDENPSS